MNILKRFGEKIKTVSRDFIYNIMASVILTGTMQLIVYPFLAKKLTSGDYGTIVTVMGVINTIAGSLGTALNNTRIIMNNDYAKKGEIGDFNPLLIVVLFLSFFSIIGISFFYFGYAFGTSLILGLISLFVAARQYITVEYRLILNFKKLLVSNIFGAIGYLIGLFYGGRYWALMFLTSEVFAMIYVLYSTSIWKEKLIVTRYFETTANKTMILLISVFFSNTLTYFDRIFLYPTLGSEAVSIYTVASFMGKSLAIVFTPIGGVLLGYFAQNSFRMSKKKFRLFNVSILGISAFFAILIFLIGPFITRLLYSEIYPMAREYLFIANGAAVVAVICNMIQTVILKFSPTYFQIVKEILYLFTYLLLCFLLIPTYGLVGFCIATLLSNIIKYITITVMGELTFRAIHR
ncbi:hypothetical protein LK536_17575 [Lachnoclostridium pacaense]|uniref:lipopolysaccharide biosynthesis protein n=1 Tax=Enterocloster hominis (ex Hitch et al. 2024) TaxID=1917870 RepID=UPI001D115E0D|nr:hypothetical protein [Lachnoclostridium pacaense]MCC2878090.1 hypothetical protein [Lachnoclostridium pacaense]